MKERPILMSAPMVNAILQRKKKTTRRVMKVQPILSDRNPPNFSDTAVGDVFICPDFLPTSKDVGNVFVEVEAIGCYHNMGSKNFIEKHCPYGVPGDRLWVRETTWHNDQEDLYAYRADGEMPDRMAGQKWKPSIFMPRRACRISLEIEDVKISQLHRMTPLDALDEGVMALDAAWIADHFPEYAAIVNSGNGLGLSNIAPPLGPSPLERFRALWESINGLGTWNLNPYLWQVDFRRIDEHV